MTDKVTVEVTLEGEERRIRDEEGSPRYQGDELTCSEQQAAYLVERGLVKVKGETPRPRAKPGPKPKAPPED